MNVYYSDRLRKPDNLNNLMRFTALRPYLAIGLPLSCAIVSFPKSIAVKTGTLTIAKTFNIVNVLYNIVRNM